MDRYLINVEHLPQSKKEVLINFLKNKELRERKFFLVGLILFGFCCNQSNKLKENFKSINISASGNGGDKYRIQINNEKLINCLSEFKTPREKLSIVYYFLFCGLCRFCDLLENPEFSSKKELDKIEKDLFFCGLSKYLDLGKSEIRTSINFREKSKKDKNHMDVSSSVNVVSKKKIDELDKKTNTSNVNTNVGIKESVKVNTSSVVDSSLNKASTTAKSDEATAMVSNAKEENKLQKDDDDESLLLVESNITVDYF